MRTRPHWLESPGARMLGLLLALATYLLSTTPALAAFGEGTPTVSNPSIFTGQASPKIDGTTGAFTTRIPLDIPPGRNGVQPDIALDYNSQNTEDGIVGYGWTLSIPYIQRLNKTGSQNLYGNNPFYMSSLDGELATTSSATSSPYAARVDDGSFRSYTYSTSTNSWTMYDKNGTRYQFGASGQSQQSATTSTDRVYKWMLEEVRDTNNNYIEFAYLKESNQIYPYQITYTGNGTTDGPATITFATSTRSDPFVSYKSGFKVTTNYRISQITVAFNGANVRQYALSYTTGANGYRSLLSSVQETGWNDAGSSTTLPATTFAYENAPSTLFYTISSSTMPVNGQSYVISDTNGNGVNDVNEFYFNQTSSATGSKMFIDQSTTTTTVVPPEWWAYGPDSPTPRERGVRYLDVTGDGKADVARGEWDDVNATSTQKLWINGYATSTGYAWTLASTTPIAQVEFDSPSGYWKLDESSGNPADSTSNSNTLTNNNSVSFASGKVNNAATFTSASSTYLSISDASQTGLDPTSKFSCSGWVKFNTLPSSDENVFCGKYDSGNLSYSVEFGVEPNGIYVIYSKDGTVNASSYEEFDSPSGIFSSTGTWYHVAVAVDATNRSATAWVNGATTTMTRRASNGAFSIYDGTAPFTLGALNYSASVTRKLNGTLDETGFWKSYLLTQSDVTSLYNGGSGRSYPFSTSTASVVSGVVPPFFWNGAASNGNITTGLFGDVNGDRLPDYALSLDSSLSGIPSNSTYLGNGAGWDNGTTTIFVAAKQLPAATSTNTNSMLIDINGDGLDDWMYSDASSTRTILNTSTGWESSSDSRWDISTTTLFQTAASPPTFADRGMRFFDINGDGLTDYIRSYNVTASGTCSTEVATVQQVMLNTGSGWATSTAYTLPAYITSGDGSANPCTYNEYGNWYGNGQMKQDVIATTTYSKGGSTTVNYGLTTQLGRSPLLPYSLLVVTSLVNHDGLGSNEQTDYLYGDGLQYLPSNVTDRKFAGFATTTETRPDRVTTTYYNQGNTIQTAIGEQSDGYPHINHPFRVDISTTGGTLAKKTLNRWDAVEHGSGAFVGLGRELVQTYASDATHRESATEYTYSSTNNDLTQINHYGEVTGASDGTFTDVAGDSRTSLLSYAASSSVNMSLPIEKKILDNSSATSTYTKIFYDLLSFGPVNVGNPTRQEDWATTTLYASTTKTFTSYGLVATSTDRGGNATAYTYDSFNLYPATTTNALSHATGYQYNYSNGKVKLTFDPSSRLTTNTFDGVGRVTEVKQSDTATPSTLVIKSTFSYTDSTTTPSLAHESSYLNSATTTDAYSYYDGLGRLLQERRSSENSASSTVTDFVYNTAGLLSSKSFPYFSGGTSRTTTSSTGTLFSNYTYDPLSRITAVGNALGTTTNTYSKWTTTITDALNQAKDHTFDAYGNLAQVVEHIASTTATTAYTYNAANNLTKITDASGNIRNFSYDGLGRRLSAQDLHTSDAPSFGTWTYTYDDGSNLTSQADPKSQVVNRTYDSLNRMLTEDYTGQSGTEVTNTYDSCGNGKGYLCMASSTVAKITNTYDVLGRISAATTTISGTDYGVAYSYDRQGNVTQLIYPNNTYVSTLYNLAGLPSRIQRVPSGSSSYSDVVTTFNYVPIGKASYIDFGNGVESNYTYDSTKLYRLTNIHTTAPGAGGEGLPEEGEIFLPDTSLSLLAPEGMVAGVQIERQREERPVVETAPDVPTTTETMPPSENAPAATTTAESTASFEASSTPDISFEIVAATPAQASTTAAIGEMPPAPNSPVSDMLVGKSGHEKATIKGREMAKIGSIARTTVGKYDVEVVSMNPIEGGVEVFARAWDQGGSIGFGKDGSVEIERFRIINPALLVKDPQGTIKISKSITLKAGTAEHTETYREDLREALLQTIADTIDFKKEKFSGENIVTGKVGNTTTTVYPAHDKSFDGRNNYPVGGAYSVIHDKTAADSIDSGSATVGAQIRGGNVSGNYDNMTRSGFTFDTSSIPDADTISSATFGVVGGNGLTKEETISGQSISVVGFTPASQTAYVVGDYDQFGTTRYADSDLTITSWNTDGTTYNTWTFNTAGKNAIVATGNTVIGARMRSDVNNAAPTWASNSNGAYAGFTMSAQVGTTKDPKLVVEHSAIAGSGGLQNITYTYDAVGNITRVTDVSDTLAMRTVEYTYDSLNRLLTASTTAASSTPYVYAYTYDALGNMLTGGTAKSTANVTGATSYWKFDESSGAASDSGGSGNTLTNNNTITYSAGHLNNAADLVAANSQSFTIANGSWTNLNPSTSFSLSFWVKLTSLPGSGQYSIVTKSDGTTSDFRVMAGANASGNNSIYVLWSDNGSFNTTQAHLGEYDGPASYFTSGDVGTWVHVAIVADATNQTVTAYKNGTATSLTKRSGSNASTISQSAVRFDVGRTGTTYYHNGSLDEMRFWKNYKLTASEVSSLANETYGGSNIYAYIGTGRPNPHAVTSIGSGTATSTYSYDNNGNLTSVISGATTTLHAWDYANRLTSTAIGSGGSTTTITYAYDWLGNRVQQVTSPSTGSGQATTTTHYPSKFYSAIVGATTTEYIYSGDTLISTVDISGASTTVRYIHPDHLGSTNVVTDSTGLATSQVLDYYPYGATRINSRAGADAGRKYIGQFADTSDLDYLNARYYDPARGQFISQDPVFWEDPINQNLENPQSLNSYAYANDNPISGKDPSGRELTLAAAFVILSALTIIVAGLSAIQTGGGGGSSAFGEALRGVDQVLTGVGHYVTSTAGKAIAGTVGAISAVTFNPGANMPALPPITSYGSTAVTTPYVVGTPYLVTTSASGGTASINLAKGGSRPETQKPIDAPSGTMPIDRAGVPRDVIHKIKKQTGGEPEDWYGITRDRDVVRTGPDGKTEPIGPLEPWLQGGGY